MVSKMGVIYIGKNVYLSGKQKKITMKQIFKIFIVAAIAFFAAENAADAQLLKNIIQKTTSATHKETASEGTLNGKAAGAALKDLYSQYKTDKKLDMSNLNNIMNLATLASNIKGLKDVSNKSAFYKDFLSGLIKGSDNLVNESNGSTIMQGLTNLVKSTDLSGLTDVAGNTKSKISNALSGASNKANTAIENASEIATSVGNLLNLFK
jgi:hypothetical protein